MARKGLNSRRGEGTNVGLKILNFNTKPIMVFENNFYVTHDVKFN
jgi:hypothetical protein